MTDDHLTSTDLQAFITRHGIAAEIIHLPSTTLTVPEAAEVLGVSPNQIIKSILFLADGVPLLAVGCGTARLGWKPLAQHLGLSRRRLKTASAAVVQEVTGFVVGSVPPFGHKTKLRTVVDTAVYTQPFVYGGGGDIDALMRIDTAELRRVLGDEVAEIREQ